METSDMNTVEALRDQPARAEPGDGPRIDLNELWHAAGRPRGRSPRQWVRSTFGRAAIALIAARRGVGPEEVFVDPGGAEAGIQADVAIALVYTAALDPGRVEAGLAALDPDDQVDVRSLLAAEARRREEAERLRDEYRILVNRIDRIRPDVTDPWAGPDAPPGHLRPRDAPPLGDPNHVCALCGSRESIFCASTSPERWFCHECRLR